jgi:hypothetical protein
MKDRKHDHCIVARKLKKATSLHEVSRMTPFQEEEDDEDISSIMDRTTTPASYACTPTYQGQSMRNLEP